MRRAVQMVTPPLLLFKVHHPTNRLPRKFPILKPHSAAHWIWWAERLFVKFDFGGKTSAFYLP